MNNYYKTLNNLLVMSILKNDLGNSKYFVINLKMLIISNYFFQ